MKFNYKTSRGNFIIKVIESEPEKREAYNDVRFKFSITIKCENYPNWKINFSNVRGRISKIEDKERLIDELKNKIKLFIDKDEQGEYSISDLDLTK
ncbi:hypothetical protein L6261_03625 [Candidatus Parcubacteria bacterium]|nr:hypothetical protein [Candidatus Parcubacteria bacterium]